MDPHCPFGVQAYHVIFTAYGFWLPNDPRGSWSDFVRKWELLRFGPATKVTTRASLARKPHDRQLRLAAKQALAYPPVVYDGRQALSIAHGFAKMVEKSGYVVYACSILPEHVHMVLKRFRYYAETMVRLLKAEATHEMILDGRHPLAAWREADGSYPCPWARKCWKVFLNTPADIRRAIRYVENNPVKEGKRLQHWPFVRPFDSGGSANRR
jgi:REP element-mobilizing transposase RayT